MSVDSDSDSTAESVLVKFRQRRLTKVKNRSRHSVRSTPTSTAESVDQSGTAPRRRTARATAGRNANPYNIPRSATLRTTAVVVQPSFDDLSEAMANLGAELSSSLGSMLHEAWLKAHASMDKWIVMYYLNLSVAYGIATIYYGMCATGNSTKSILI